MMLTMTVKELIDFLHRFPGDALVAIEGGGNCNGYNIDKDDIRLEEMYRTDGGSGTYGDYCSDNDGLSEDGLRYTKEKVVMFWKN